MNDLVYSLVKPLCDRAGEGLGLPSVSAVARAVSLRTRVRRSIADPAFKETVLAELGLPGQDIVERLASRSWPWVWRT